MPTSWENRLGTAANPVPVNTANVEELCRLFGVGPALAQAIIDRREANGPFSFPEDLLSVKGITLRTLEQIVQEITLVHEVGAAPWKPGPKSPPMSRRTGCITFWEKVPGYMLSLLGLVILSPIFPLHHWREAFLSRTGFLSPKEGWQNKVPFESGSFVHAFRCPQDVRPICERRRAYITPVGKVLRATSIDELPQFANVFWGQMSLIGPRPALWNQDDLVALRDQYRANDVLPGMSGWAQVNGRDELSLEKKARRDGEYAQNISFRLDMKCLLLTFVKVFNREGIAEGKEGKHYSVLRVEGKK